MILERLELGGFGTNCYIIGDEKTKEGIVIDPGDEAPRILAAIKESGLKITLIVLTHSHLDHLGALTAVKDATKAPVAIHRLDAPNMTGQEQVAKMFGLDFQPPPPADKLLDDGDIIKIGKLQFKVLHTPGHSPGGICLVGNDIVFSGDTLFNMGIGRTDLGGNYQQLLHSIANKLLTLPDKTMVYPGHGPETTIIRERLGNPFLR